MLVFYVVIVNVGVPHMVDGFLEVMDGSPVPTTSARPQ